MRHRMEVRFKAKKNNSPSRHSLDDATRHRRGVSQSARPPRDLPEQPAIAPFFDLAGKPAPRQPWGVHLCVIPFLAAENGLPPHL